MRSIRAIVFSLVFLSVPVLIAADNYYALYSNFGGTYPYRRAGVLITYDNVNPVPCSLDVAQAVSNTDIWVRREHYQISPWTELRRGVLSFCWTKVNPNELIKSVRLRLSVRSFRKDMAETDVWVHYKNCKLGGSFGDSCSGAFLPADWYDTQTYFATIHWNDLPQPLDSLFLDVPVAAFTSAASDTIDFMFVGSNDLGFSRCTWPTNTNWTDEVKFCYAGEDSIWMRPVLYITTKTGPECAEPGRIWYNAATEQLSYCDGTFIRRLKEE